MLLIMVLVWVYAPGELVMKNGKLMPYQGAYSVENGNVHFVSKTGESLQIPVATVDFEKTAARDATKAAEQPAADTRSRSERDFEAMIEETPGRKICITALGTPLLDDFEDGPSPGGAKKSGNRASFTQNYQTRLNRLLALRASLLASISESCQADPIPVSRQFWWSQMYVGSRLRRANNPEDSKGDLREQLARVNQSIRKLQQEALSHGVALNVN